MNDVFHDIKIRIPANKFYPLYTDSSRQLLRKNLLAWLSRRSSETGKGIQVIARAGQGKTTLTSQFLEYHHLPNGWYQIGEEDHDPILFITSLLSCLMQALPGFSSPVLERMLVDGEISPLDFRHAGNVLLHDLSAYLPDVFYLVFDDLHLLEGAESTNAFLAYLLDTSPPSLRFFLTSRRPVNIDSKFLKYKDIFLQIDNEALALSESETFELFTHNFGMAVPRERCRRIHRATDGWITGLILEATALAADSEKQISTDEESLSVISFTDEGLSDYFRREVCNHIAKDLLEALLKLSLLEEIPVFLAENITGRADIKEELSELTRRNFFVRKHNPNNTLFSFHHLFGMVLRQEATGRLDPETITDIYRQAATHCAEQKRFITALRYYQLAEDYFSMDSIVREEGLALLALNQTVSLLKVLEKVPPAVLEDYGWLSLCLGMAFYEVSPEQSAIPLHSAQQTFIKQNEEKGELQTLSQLIYYYCVHTGLFKKGADLLPRAHTLFQKFSDELPIIAKILIARNLALGFTYFKTNFVDSYKYINIAEELTGKHQVTGLAASIVAVRGYIHLLQSTRQLNIQDAEKAYRILLDPHLGTINRLALQAMQIDTLQTYGDFEEYHYREAQLIGQVGTDILGQTVFGPYLSIWRIGILVAQGRLVIALEILRARTDAAGAPHTPHLLSQFKHWEALILAVLQENQEAVRAAEQSLALQREVGGPLFEILNTLILGVAYGQLHQVEKAEELLSNGIEQSLLCNLPYLTACGCLNRAYLYLITNKKNAANEDLRRGLSVMKVNGYKHFFGWLPAIIQRVLSEAVKENIEADFARILAAERLNLAVLPSGEVIPLLQIRVLGDLVITFNDQVICKSENFTPAHRHLLSLLITAAHQKISQEKIQLFFWPDSAPDKARTNFDTLLSRLRSTLAKTVAPYQLKHYLSLQQGILRLENCRIDALDFAGNAEKGLDHARCGEWWQAGNCFHAALSLWRGCLPEDIFRADEVRDYCAYLRELLLKITRQWADHLLQSDRLDEAISILTDTLRYDPTNDELVKKLYQAYCQRNDITRGRQVLQRYEEFLHRENYSPTEIAELLEQIYK